MTLEGAHGGESPIPDGGSVDHPDHEAWRDAQSTLDATVDGHEVEIACWEDGPENDAAGSDSATGDSDGNPPIVLLHGIPTWSYLWRGVAPALAEDHRVLAPDLAGYGYSSNYDGFDRSIRAQEQVVDAVLEHLDSDEAVLVAHDVGGGVALRYAAHHPDRVAGLVVSNAVCYDSWPVEFVSDLGLPETADRDGEDVASELKGAFRAGVYADEPDSAFVSGMVAPWRREGGPRALARAAVATNTNHTTEIDYDGIDAPLLCLWGGDDVMQPLPFAECLADDVGGEVVALDRAYHWVPHDRPDAYADHLRSFATETVSGGE